MNSAIPVFAPEDQTPEMMPLKKRHGVTVITRYGRAVTFGVSRARTESFLKSMALGKNHELMAAMQARKAARLHAAK
jgi:uncharacterized Rmd1/YagE family protein